MLVEFEAAPWLLPPRTKALRYAGVHQLEELLQLRATPQDNHTKTIAVLLFSKNIAPMAQNTSEQAGRHPAPCARSRSPPVGHRMLQLHLLLVRRLAATTAQQQQSRPAPFPPFPLQST